MKKLIDYLEKSVIGLSLAFLLLTGMGFTKGNLFSQNAYALPPDDIDWKMLFCIDCDNPCPVPDGMCVVIEIEG